MKRKYSVPFLLFALMIAQSLFAQSPEQKGNASRGNWQLPDNPIGRKTAALLETLERGEGGYARTFIQENFAPGFRDDYPIAEHLAWFQQRFIDLQGDFRKGGVLMTPNRVEVGLRAGKSGALFTLIVEIQDQEPHLITGLGFESAKDLAKKFEDIDLSNVEVITTFEPFKEVFNSDSGFVRLVMILSPT